MSCSFTLFQSPQSEQQLFMSTAIQRHTSDKVIVLHRVELDLICDYLRQSTFIIAVLTGCKLVTHTPPDSFTVGLVSK